MTCKLKFVKLSMALLRISISSIILILLSVFFGYVTIETLHILKESPNSNFGIVFLQQIPKCLVDVQKKIPILSKVVSSFSNSEDDVNTKIMAFILSFILTIVALFYIIP